MGEITNVVRRYVPASYKAMIGPSEATDYYSLADLQSLAEYVEAKLFATVADPTAEGSVWTRVQLEFIGKVTTVKFIPAAIDYWMDQQEQVQVTGSNETESFASRLNHLREVQRQLMVDLESEAPFVIPATNASAEPQVSYGDNGRGVLITPSPHPWPGWKRHGHELYPWEVSDWWPGGMW